MIAFSFNKREKLVLKNELNLDILEKEKKKIKEKKPYSFTIIVVTIENEVDDHLDRY